MSAEELITEARVMLKRPDGADLIFHDELLVRDITDALEAATSTIDRIDTALRADGRSAMLIVAAQEIITQYREGEDA